MLRLVPLATTGIGSVAHPAWLGDRTRGSVKFTRQGAALEETLDHLDPVRMRVSPDYGLMMAGRALAREKLRWMTQAAAQLRGQVG